MPANEKYADLEFPLGGLNLLQEVQEQPAGTTPVAENVRSINSDTLRARGGSRPGLIRYISAPPFVGADLIQHLAVIVDPQADRLGLTTAVPQDDWVEDPLNPGFYIPPGGWGYQPNPNSPPPPSPPTSSIAFVQSANGTTNTFSSPDQPLVLTLGAAPVAGHLLIVVVKHSFSSDHNQVNPSDVIVSTAVQNSGGTAFAQAGSTVVATNSSFVALNPGNPQIVYWEHYSIWYRVSTGAADQTIHVISNPTSTGGEDATEEIEIIGHALEYSGTATTSVFSAANGNEDSAGDTPTTLSSGNVATTANGLIVIAVGHTTGIAITTPSSSTFREPVGSPNAGAMNTYDHFPVNVGTENPTNATATFSGSEVAAIIAAAFKVHP